jgi:uncharacterized protein HemY
MCETGTAGHLPQDRSEASDLDQQNPRHSRVLALLIQAETATLQWSSSSPVLF